MRRKISVVSTDHAAAATAAAVRSFNNSHAREEHLGGDELLRARLTVRNCDYVLDEVARDNTAGIGHVWPTLAQRCHHWLSQGEIAGVIVAHEVEALEETAYFLHRVLPCSEAPVVLACTERSAISPGTPIDLGDAFVVATTRGARGVVVVRDGAIYAGAEILEQYPTHEGCGLVGAEPIGFVEGNEVELLRSWPAPALDALDCFNRCISSAQWPRVEIVVNHAGNDGDIVHELIRSGVAGIVAAGIGESAVRRDFEESLLYAAEGGISVMRSAHRLRGRASPQAVDKLPATIEPLPQKVRIDLLLTLLDPQRGINHALKTFRNSS